MELTFLGRGAALSGVWQYERVLSVGICSSWTLANPPSRRPWLIDMRAPERIYVILTHLHADHADRWRRCAPIPTACSIGRSPWCIRWTR